MHRRRIISAIVAVTALPLPAPTARAQLRVATWNVSNYSGGREGSFQTAVYGVFEGRSMAPDIIIGQEFVSEAGAFAFRNLLNGAPGSPGDWAAAPYINGRDTDNAVFFRRSKATLLGVSTVSPGGPAPHHPRNVERYDLRLAGYTSDGAVLACYSSHMKAGSTSDDQARRLVEAEVIRTDAEALTPSFQFLLGADLNIQDSAQAAYQELVADRPNNRGRFFDPIATPGHWQGNGPLKLVHTQDPARAPGMDDRYDQILVSAGLIDGDGFEYIGSPAIPYSTTTWDDANHTYRAWGNDGTSFGELLTVAGSTMVGPVIAQALIDAADGAGHVPVFLDLRVPPRITSPLTLEFGQVAQGSIGEATPTVTNDGDVALWTAAGIAVLVYSVTTTTGFSAPAGTFVEPPGGSGSDHPIRIDTTTIGPRAGTLTIASNAPDERVRTVALTGEVIAPTCNPADTNCDGAVTPTDVAPFVGLLSQTTVPCSPCAGDMNGDGATDGQDTAGLVSAVLQR